MNKSPLSDEHYLGGRCHLFAYVLAKMLNQPITVWWDDAAYDDDFDPIPFPCLIHCVVSLPVESGEDPINIDITGCHSSPDLFEYTDLRVETYNPVEFSRLIVKHRWPLFQDNIGERLDLEQRAIKLIETHKELLSNHIPVDLTAAIAKDKTTDFSCPGL